MVRLAEGKKESTIDRSRDGLATPKQKDRLGRPVPKKKAETNSSLIQVLLTISLERSMGVELRRYGEGGELD